jgi:hypothetical protein
MVETVGVEPAELVRVLNNFKIKMEVYKTTVQPKFSLLKYKYVGKRGSTWLSDSA